MIPLVAPCITELDTAYLAARVDDGLLEDESELARFEEAFAQTVGCQYAVAVNSGTTALTLALRVLGFHRHKIRVPTYSCVALLHAAHANGGSCEFVDGTFRVPTAHATQDDNADVLVHLFGLPTYSRAPVTIEDVTLSLGATSGLELGTRLGMCSTHMSKMISTGRGGVVYGNDRELLDRVRRMAYYDDFPYNGTQQASLGMSTLQAALGVSQLSQLDAFITRRRELASTYTEKFTEAGIECPVSIDHRNVFFRYLISVNDPVTRIEQLAERGIEAGRGIHPPLHLLVGLVADFPGATASHEHLLSVPCHPNITDKQAAYIADQVVAVCAP